MSEYSWFFVVFKSWKKKKKSVIHLLYMQRDISPLLTDWLHVLFLSPYSFVLLFLNCLDLRQSSNHHLLTLLYFCCVKLWSSLNLVTLVTTFKVMSRKNRHWNEHQLGKRKEKKKNPLCNELLTSYTELGGQNLFLGYEEALTVARKVDRKIRHCSHISSCMYAHSGFFNIRNSDSQNHFQML